MRKRAAAAVLLELLHQENEEHEDGFRYSIQPRRSACALEVHKTLGPGLLESTYEGALATNSPRLVAWFSAISRCPRYKEVKLDCGFRLDLLVEEQLAVELKSVENLLPVHEAQLLTYLKLSAARSVS